MKSNRTRSRSRQRGFSMFELTLTVTIGTAALIALLPMQIEKAETQQAEVSASQLFTIGDVAQQYRIDNGTWPGEATNCVIADVNTALITGGYLTTAQTTTAWGSAIETTCTPAHFDVATVAPNLVRAQQAAGLLHTVTVTPDVNAAHEARVSSLFPAGGAPSLGNVLHRIEVAGHPELNQMETDLDMNGNDINNVQRITSEDAESDTLTVKNNTTLCNGDTTDCSVAVNADGRFTNPNDGNVNFELVNNGKLVITNPAGGGDLTVNGVIHAPNETILADRGLEWGNKSRLTTQAGSDTIELGGNDGQAGNGTPSIDFHYAGQLEDYNVRFINSSSRVMTLTGSGGNLATFIVEGDGIYTNNLQVIGDMSVKDVVSSVSNKSLSQAVQTMTTVPAGTLIPIPTYCADFGLVPQIYTAVNQAAQGEISTPLYQFASYADVVNGNAWKVNMKVTTEAGVFDSGNGTMPASAMPYNKIQVSVKCERV